MNISLSEFLTHQQADRETILQAARYTVAELTDDLPPAHMKHQLAETYPDEAQAAIDTLQCSLDDLTDHALAVLSWAWYEGKEETVRQAVINAQTKLPVIEVSIIVAAVLYGLHLWTTKGVKKTVHRIEMHPDGTFVETTEVENFSPGLTLRWNQDDNIK